MATLISSVSLNNSITLGSVSAKSFKSTSSLNIEVGLQAIGSDTVNGSVSIDLSSSIGSSTPGKVFGGLSLSNSYSFNSYLPGLSTGSLTIGSSGSINTVSSIAILSRGASLLAIDPSINVSPTDKTLSQASFNINLGVSGYTAPKLSGSFAGLVDQSINAVSKRLLKSSVILDNTYKINSQPASLVSGSLSAVNSYDISINPDNPYKVLESDLSIPLTTGIVSDVPVPTLEASVSIPIYTGLDTSPYLVESVNASLYISYADKVSRSNLASYIASSDLSLSHGSDWRSKDTNTVLSGIGSTYVSNAVKSLGSEYSDAGSIALSIASKWDKASSILVNLDTIYKHSTQLGASIGSNYDLNDFDLVSVNNQAWYSDQSAGLLETTPVAKVVLRGRPIEFVGSITLSSDESGIAWNGSVSLANLEDYYSIDVGTEISIFIGSDEYVLNVTEKGLSRSFSSIDMTVSLSSFIATKADEEIDSSYAGYLASEAVADALGMSLSWGVVDWILPVSANFYQATRYDIAREIVESIGAVIRSNNDGSIRVEYLYPVSVDKLNSVGSNLVISDMDQILESSESLRKSDGYNRFTLTNEDESEGDSHDFNYTSVNENKGYVDVFMQSKRPDIDLGTTGSDQVEISNVEFLEVTLTESIEIKSGVSSVAHEISSIKGYKYAYQNLGSVTHNGGSISTEIDGYSVLEITYTTIRARWMVANANTELTQFLIIG